MADASPVVPISSRVAEAAVDSMFLDRWSPRAFSPLPVQPELLDSLFEAARWAPSSGNIQPWLYLYADSQPELAVFLSVLEETNQSWARTAPVLAFALAQKNRPGKELPNAWAAFDTGASWMALALEARQLGLYTHAMAGFNADLAYEKLLVPASEYQVMAAIAIGWMGDPGALPDKLRAREKPSDRKSLADVRRRGFFASQPR